MFDRLPQDITLTVLQDWLENSVLTLSRLDVAVCSNSMRSEWRQLISRVEIDQDVTRQPILNHLLWIHNRHVKVKRIIADMVMVDGLVGAVEGTLRLPIPSVTELLFKNPKVATTSLGLSQFLWFFPNLQILRFHGCTLIDASLLALFTLQCPLKELVLRNVNGVSSSVVALIIEHFGANLTLLECDALDIAALSQSCHLPLITHLSVRCRQLKNAEGLVQFCVKHCNLTSLELSGDGQMVDNDVMTRIAVACTRLRMVHVHRFHAVTANIHPVLLTNCQEIEKIMIVRMVVDVVQDGELKCCNISAEDTNLILSSVHDTVLYIPLSILDFGCVKRPLLTNNKIVRLLVDKVRSLSLKKIWLNLLSNVTKTDLQSLACHCPQLSVLGLSTADAIDRVDDDMLFTIFRECPKLMHLSLTKCAIALTDEGLTRALHERRDPSDFSTLLLSGCALLTDAVVPAVIECLPNLTELQVTGSGITKEELLSLAKHMIPRKLDRLAPSNDGDRKWIGEQLQAAQIRFCR